MRREAWYLMTIVLALTGIGVLAVFSASTVSADSMYHYLMKQALSAGLGLAAFCFATKFNYHYLKSPLVYGLIAAATLATLVAILLPGLGAIRNGAGRWIQIGGLQFQPSELAKVAVIILLAVMLTHRRERITALFRGFIPCMALVVFFAGLVAAQKDFGGPVVICVVGTIMVFVAGARWSHLIASAFPLGGAAAWLIVTDPERVSRLMIYLDPWQDPMDEGYNLIQSMAAFARGGLFGQGAGAGEQKLHYLPAAHTDFIFAVWGEEMGLMGTLFLVALFAALFLFSSRVAAYAPDFFGSMLATGIGALFTLQATINMAVATGLVPTKGLTLPFVSAGGTSLIVNMALAGILLNIALHSSLPERRRRLAPVAA